MLWINISYIIMIIHTIIKDTRLYKTVEYPCESIKSYMEMKPDKPCRTNKMLWLSEDKERALSYGKNLKIFTIQSDIDLWNLIDSDYYKISIDGKIKILNKSLFKLLDDGTNCLEFIQKILGER